MRTGLKLGGFQYLGETTETEKKKDGKAQEKAAESDLDPRRKKNEETTN